MKKMICFLLVAVMALGLAACGGSDNGDSGELTGIVKTNGSTSMEKVIGALLETFTGEHDGVTVNYEPTGSSAGITAVLEGRCDIGLSSRALKAEEKEQGLTETVLAYDGVAVIVNPENTVSNLTIQQIAAVFTGEITNWSELGGEDLEIVLIGRDASSGTRECFESVTGTADACQYRQELSSNGDVLTAVASNPAAIGYASVATVKDTVKALSVDGVEASSATVKDGTYAIQRPFVLVTKDGVALSTAAQAFFDYITSDDANDVITGAGVVPAN